MREISIQNQILDFNNDFQVQALRYGPLHRQLTYYYGNNTTNRELL